MLHTHIAFLRKFYISGFLATSFLLAFAFLFVFPMTNSFSGVQAASVLSETTLTMTTSDIALALSVDSAAGTFNMSDPSSFSVSTNNYSGYNLTIHAAEDTADYSKLVNGESALNSISSAGVSSSFNNGNWGYLPSKINSAANSDYQPAPTYAGTTIDTTAQANNEANSYSIAIGAKADYGLPAGKYSNTFVITAVANPVGYSVTYNKNTEDEVTNMPANQSGDASAQSIILSSDEPLRSGYSFINWCDGTTTTTSGVDSCTGTVYQPGDFYDTDQTAQNNLVLKAMWEEDQTPVQASATINYNSNGLTFNGGGTTNTVKYVSEEVPFETQYSHTSNIADDGTQNGNYARYQYPTEVIRFDGAAKLHIVLTYSTTSVYDWVSMWPGGDSQKSANDDFDSGMKIGDNTTGKYTTGDGSSTTIEFDVNDSAITFGWRAYYNGGYGYYAVITALDSRNMSSRAVLTSTAQGTYKRPVDSNDYAFIGWAETNNASTPKYRSEQDVKNYANITNGQSLDLYAVLVSNNYAISYDKNGGDGVNFSENVHYNTSVNLTANTFTKTGYIFNGWNTRADGKGQGFGDQDRYDVPEYSESSSNSLSLYAVWLCDTSVNTCSADEPSADGSSYNPGISLARAYELAYMNNPGAFDMGGGQTKHGLYYPVGDGTYAEATNDSYYQRPASELRFALQDINLTIQENGQTYTICQYATAVGSDVYALDLRDWKSYHVRKMADGRCWFADNLALDITNSYVQSRMDGRTNATTAHLNYLFNGGGGDNDQWPLAGARAFQPNDYSTFSHAIPEVYTVGMDSPSPNLVDTINGWNNGALYNFCAASAGTYCYGNSSGPGTPVDKPDTAIDTDGDICPTGWRLPTGRSSYDDYGEFATLLEHHVDQSLQDEDWDAYEQQFDAFRLTFRMSLPGAINSEGIMQEWVGNENEYWTSSNYNNYSMTSWTGYETGLDYDVLNRHYGGTVRCIAQQ